MLLDLLVAIAAGTAIATIAFGPRLLEHPHCPLPTRWVGTRAARERLAAARAHLAAVAEADRAAGTNAETCAYLTANDAVLDAENALRASRRVASAS